ncbi:DUF397 domain-containing protein [Spirillospora sp. NPDC046719]
MLGADRELREISKCGSWGRHRRVAVRDSRDPDGAVLTVAASGWASLLADVKAGSLDLTR